MHELGASAPFIQNTINPSKKHFTNPHSPEIFFTSLHSQKGSLTCVSTTPKDTIKSAFDKIDIETVNLTFNGIGFRETGSKWDNFCSECEVGIIQYSPLRDFEDNQKVLMILMNKIRDKRGFFILSKFPEYLLNIIKKEYTQVIDIEENLSKPSTI